MLASILIVDAAVRARDAFGRHLATGLQRRAAAQAAGVELSRSAAPVLFVAVTLFAAFALTDDNAIPFIRSIAIIAIAGTTSALLVATPIVLTMSSVRAGTPHGIRRRTFFTAFLYALEGCLDRVADRYHEMLAWTLDRRRVVPVVALGVAVLGIVVLHNRRAMVRSVDVVNTPPLMSADRTPISLAVRGPDWQTLLGVTQRIAEELRGSRGIAAVRVSAKPQDSADVTDVLTLSNDIYAANNQFASEDDPEIVAVSSPLRIDHLDGDRVVHIDADVTATTLEVLSNVTARLAAVPLPPQYRVSIGGALAERREASYGALRLLGVSCAIVTMVLAWHLRSTASVAAVVLTLGLTSLGAMASIVAARLRLDVFALLGGSAALALIAAHAIAAVDHARSRRGTAPSLRVLVIEAARVQFRPLLTTTLAAAATLGPLVRARGPGMELFATLGIAMLGGLVLGAIAVLFALPTFSIAIASHTRRTGG